MSSGDVLGGDVLGGDVLGGDVLGGDVLGGDILGGDQAQIQDFLKGCVKTFTSTPTLGHCPA